MKNVAIITARGGSKRVPRKNIKKFHGRPLIAYSIEAALKSNIFDEVMVSTDDEEIADISRATGAKIPFMRSEKSSNDFATTVDVLLEVIGKYQDNGISFENFCCIYPTAPFLTYKKIIDSYQKFTSTNSNSLFSICRFSYPIQRALRNNGEFLEMILPDNYSKRSQDLEPTYHDVGQFYWSKVDVFKESKTLFGERAVGFELSELEVQDIDTEVDWELAEIKYTKMIERSK